MKAWEFTLLLLRFLVPYEARALELRTPPQILQKLKEEGAILDWSLIQELGNDHDVPACLAAMRLAAWLSPARLRS